EVLAPQPGHGAPAVHVPAGDRAAARLSVVRIRPDRELHGAGGLASGRVERVVPLIATPAVVHGGKGGRGRGGLEVDLLNRVLAYVGDPQITGVAVERGPPRVAEAVSPDL